MLHLHPAHWHSLKKQLQQPLVLEAFPIQFLAVGFFPFFSSLSSFCLLFSTLHQGVQPLRHLRAGVSYLTKSQRNSCYMYIFATVNLC